MPRKVDMSAYPRINHFRYFSSLPNPYVGVTVQVDVTALVQTCKQQGWSFYLAFMHAAALAANRIPEFRQRIENDGIIEYDVCHTSHIELLDDGTYCYCTLHHDMEPDAYFSQAEAQRQAARHQASIEEDDDVQSLLFISCLPWLHYTAFVQPTGNDSNPRISWGKYEPDHREHLMLPVTMLAHHALVDGLQLGQFYACLDEEIARLTQYA